MPDGSVPAPGTIVSQNPVGTVGVSVGPPDEAIRGGDNHRRVGALVWEALPARIVQRERFVLGAAVRLRVVRHIRSAACRA